MIARSRLVSVYCRRAAGLGSIRRSKNGSSNPLFQQSFSSGPNCNGRWTTKNQHRSLPFLAAGIGATTLMFLLSVNHRSTARIAFCETNDSDNDNDDEECTAWGRGEKSLKQILDEHYQGKDNWPWVWCHRNENGPLFVFSGVDKDTLGKCQQVASASPNNNLLLIATREEIETSGASREEFYKCRCGIHPGPIAELDLCNKIFMLQDERVVEFDYLQIV